MIMLYRLRDINDVQGVTIMQDVILRQVAVDKFADLEHASNNPDEHAIEPRPSVLRHLRIFQSWRYDTILANIFHNQDVLPDLDWNRAWQVSIPHAAQVAHL